MKQYFQPFVLWIAKSLSELRLETIGIFVFLPYTFFWVAMLEAQYAMAKGAKYASAHHGVGLDGTVWFVLFFRICSLIGATMVVNSQLCMIWDRDENQEKFSKRLMEFSKRLIQSLGLLLIYAPMIIILIRSGF